MNEGREIKTRPSYLRWIWGLARDLGYTGVNEFKLYDVLSKKFGEAHVGQLSDETARAFISVLKSKLKYQKRKRREKEIASGVFHMPTPAQRQEALDLMKKIGVRNPDAYLSAIAQRSFNCSARTLSLVQYQAVIEILKKIVSRPKPQIQSENK